MNRELVKYYLGGAFPPFLLGIITYFFYPQLILAFSMSYFICWSLFLPELEEKTHRNSYRLSFLRLLFYLYNNLKKLDKTWPVARGLTALIILFPMIFVVNGFFVLSYFAGIFIFELWFYYWKFLHKFPHIPTSE